MLRAMAIRKIAQLGHPVLRQRAREVGPGEISALGPLLRDMLETMRDAGGVGLAAPQIHESLRLVVVEVDESDRYPGLGGVPLAVLVNPVVTPLVEVGPHGPAEADSIWVYEGCLSVSGLRGRVRRPRKVRVEALDATGAPLRLEWEGFPAAVIQHEVDHLDGILFVDRADSKTLAFLPEFGRYVAGAIRVVDGAEPA